MAAEAHNGVCSPSVNPTKVAYPLDDLARGLPSGSLVQGVPNTAGGRHEDLFVGSTGLGRHEPP